MKEGSTIIKISEIFVSLQGEGTLIGRKMTFIRTSGCNLACEYCDTKYAIKGEYMDIKSILSQVTTKDVCITGGEPLIQKHLMSLVHALKKASHWVMLETNCTIMDMSIFGLCDFISGSPKLHALSMHTINGIISAGKPMHLKFVVNSDRDVMRAISTIYKLPDEVTYILQPNGMVSKAQYEKNLRELWKIVAKMKISGRDIRVIPQLHRILFGHKGGI